MAPDRRLKEFALQLRRAEEGVERDVAAEQRRWRYRIHRGHVWFDEEVRRAHARLRQTIPAYIREGRLRNLLSAPLIYSLVVPLAILDVWLTAYQWICFPIYGIAIVPRRRYLVFDRRHLAYLNGVEKVNCTFCSYANGLLAYVREIAARTEQYWCPVRHAGRTVNPHEHYRRFVEFGDGEGYHRNLMTLREELKPLPPADSDRPASPDTIGESH